MAIETLSRRSDRRSPVNGLELTELKVTESAMYALQPLRGYDHLDLSDDNLNLLDEMTEGGRTTNSQTLSKVAGKLLTYSTNAVESHIDGGWDNRRFAVQMRLEQGVISREGRTVYLVSGYTDYVGIEDVNGRFTVDDDMRIYINTIITMKEMIIPDGKTGRSSVRYKVTNVEQMMFESGIPSLGRASSRYRTSLRPRDVASNLSSRAAYKGATVVDSLCDKPVLTNRSDSSPIGWLSRFGNQYRRSVNEAMREYADGYDGDLTANIYESISMGLASHTHSCSFIAWLRNTSLYFRKEGYITWGELEAEWPEADPTRASSVCDVGLRDRTWRRQERDHRSVATMMGAEDEQLLAHAIQQALPSIMSHGFINNISFVATNDTRGGKDSVRVPSVNSMMENAIGFESYIDDFKDRILEEVIYPMTHDSQIRYKIKVDFNLNMESYISIELEDSDEPMEFNGPIFADSCNTATMTSNSADIESLSDDVDQLMHHIFREQSHVVRPEKEGVDYDKRGRAASLRDPRSNRADRDGDDRSRGRDRDERSRGRGRRDRDHSSRDGTGLLDSLNLER